MSERVPTVTELFESLEAQQNQLPNIDLDETYDEQGHKVQSARQPDIDRLMRDDAAEFVALMGRFAVQPSVLLEPRDNPNSRFRANRRGGLTQISQRVSSRLEPAWLLTAQKRIQVQPLRYEKASHTRVNAVTIYRGLAVNQDAEVLWYCGKGPYKSYTADYSGHVQFGETDYVGIPVNQYDPESALELTEAFDRDEELGITYVQGTRAMLNKPGNLKVERPAGAHDLVPLNRIDPDVNLGNYEQPIVASWRNRLATIAFQLINQKAEVPGRLAS